MSITLSALLADYGENPISKKRLSTYIAQKEKLSKYMKFSFRNTKNFSSAQKGVITKAWQKYANTLKAIKENEARFIPATPTQIKLVRKKLKTTNKGVFIFEEGITHPRLKTVGKGRQRRVEIKYNRGHRREQYYPLPPNTLITDFINFLVREHKPRYVAVGINNYRGRISYQADKIDHYVTDLFAEFEHEDKAYLLTGVYLIWAKPHTRKKKMKGQVFQSIKGSKKATKKRHISASKTGTKKKVVKRTKKKVVKRTKKKVVKRTKKKVVKRTKKKVVKRTKKKVVKCKVKKR